MMDVIADQERMILLQLEWTALELADTKSVIDAWETQVAALRTEQSALRRAHSWHDGPTDFLGIIDKLRWETFHSAILAWLMRPSATHGLSTHFLIRLLKQCHSNWASFTEDDLWAVSVECEVARDDTRADIVVRSSGFTLVIENKVDAAEGHRQCERLQRHFGMESNPAFAFLTPNGVAPKTAVGQDVFHLLSYRQIRQHLQAALAEGSPSATGRAIAVNYLESLKHLIGGSHESS